MTDRVFSKLTVVSCSLCGWFLFSSLRGGYRRWGHFQTDVSKSSKVGLVVCVFLVFFFADDGLEEELVTIKAS